MEVMSPDVTDWVNVGFPYPIGGYHLMPFSEKVEYVFNCGTHCCTSTVRRLKRMVILLERRNPKRLQVKRTKVTVLVSLLEFYRDFQIALSGP